MKYAKDVLVLLKVSSGIEIPKPEFSISGLESLNPDLGISIPILEFEIPKSGFAYSDLRIAYSKLKSVDSQSEIKNAKDFSLSVKSKF